MTATDSLTLREGHRSLLATFREFVAETESPDGSLPETARAVVAFLRHSLLPFAREEEAVLGMLAADLGGAALDHAFLAAEIDALAAEARAPAFNPDAIRRRLHRLEAVLELHLSREEERETDPPSLPTAASQPASRAPRTMGDAEARAFLRVRRWGVLATVGADGPYAVPVGYGFDGRALFLATGAGRKLCNLLRTREVCLTVAQVESGERWASVVATGCAASLEGALQRTQALRHLYRGREALSASALLRAATASVFRIDVRELSGRARGWG